MKKLYLLALSFPILLAGCKGPNERQTPVDPVEPVDPSGEDVTASSLKEEELAKFPSLLINKLKTYKSYKQVSKGNTVATVLGMDVDQSIDVTAIKGEYSYLHNASHSDIKDTAHVAYYHENTVVSKDKDTEYEKRSLDEYLKIYGTYPFENTIEGYLLTDGAVKSVSRTKVNDDYQFSLVFNKDKSANNVGIQMQKFGGLDEPPTFEEDINIAITVKEDFTPITLQLSSHYTAKVFLPSDCKQNYTVTYSDFDETIEIPGLSDVQSYFDN